MSDPLRFAHKVRESLLAGEITLAQAERIIGYQLLRASAGEDRAIVNRNTDWRRRAEIAETGLVLAGIDDGGEGVEIEMDDLHAQLSDSALWQG